MSHLRAAPLLALVALFALLLAACGGAAPTAAPQSTDSLRESAPTTAAASGGDAPAMIMPTAAPAATMAPAAEAPVEAAVEGAAGAAGDGSGATGGAPASEPLPTPAPTSADGRERPLGQEASLRAGEIDDNTRFDDYLAYLQGYGISDVLLADVSERYMVSVFDDNQRPVLDARVTIYDGERAVFRGRTYAGGKLLFFPRLFDTGNASSFRVVAEAGQARAETSFERGVGSTVELGLRGVTADPTLRLDLLFLLDTTGSMGDELGRIQETIDSIAGRIDAFTPRPTIRYGLVAFKDVDDEYVTKTAPFTTDLAAFRAELRALSANGGGDTPEAVDEALYEAVLRAEWSEASAVRLVFLVGDAGPHVPSRAQFSYLNGAREAAARGVKIYPIAASNTDPQAEYVFRQLAQQTMAGFVFLTYQPGASSGAPGESTTLEAGEQAYTVERLDDLIVGIVERELGAAVGAR
jgi:hypothetical protein